MKDLLKEWLPTQRWFGGKGRVIESVEETWRRPVGPASAVVVEVQYAEGEPERYQLLLAEAPSVDERLEHAVIGAHDDLLLYDAVHDPAVTSALLAELRPEDADLAPRVLGGEQSNTSVVFGDTLILKLFRRLQPGANPDIEVTKALADAGSTHVAQPLAWYDGDVAGEATTLGLLQRPDVICLDTGCVWGGSLTALRLQDRKLVQVKCSQFQDPLSE